MKDCECYGYCQFCAVILNLNVSCSGGETMHVTTDDLIFEHAPPKDEETEEDRLLRIKQSERPKDFGQPYNLSTFRRFGICTLELCF